MSTETPQAEWTPTGADGDLDTLLNGVYACTRVWEAWGYGTMTEDDFEEPSDPGVRGDLIAWRNAAVAAVNTWWIATGELAKGGEKVLGPFGSKSLALDVRSYMERVNAPVTYWVDSTDPEES